MKICCLGRQLSALLLVAVMMLSLVACVKETAPMPPIDDTPPTDSTPPADSDDSEPSKGLSPSTPTEPSDPTSFVPTRDYVIVYGSTVANSAALRDSIDYLNAAMQRAYGFSLASEDDSYDPSVGMMPNPYEILIGQTSRRHSRTLSEGLAADDYAYSIVDKRVIVICGGSLASTQEAVKKFCADVIGYTGNGDSFSTPPRMTVGATYTNRLYETVTVNGASLSEWTIGFDSSSADARGLAENLADSFSRYTGERIKVLKSTALTGEETNMIAIGGIGRSMSKPFLEGQYYDSTSDEKGSVISMLATNSGDLQFLLDILYREMQKEIQDKAVSFTIPQSHHAHFDMEDRISVSWKLESETRTQLYDGVTYIEQLFYDQDRRPYRTYVLILDSNKVTLRMGSANDGYDRVPSTPKTTLQHMQAAVANGKNIIAGVNGNYFNMGGDCSPNGLALKDGVLINASRADLPFFAVTDTGEIIIDEGNTYNAYVDSGKNFVQGVAAGPMFLKNGLLTTAATDDAIHPRTVAGVTADGKIILGVIDGRQANHSNGATMARCALWMHSLGAVDAINLDGGGSSSFVLRDTQTNTYEICNSPSDGQLRKIYNSLLVELK